MNTINLGILAHVDAGKTTLTEGLLFHSGIISSMGKVDKGTTITDSMSIEKQRGITIRSSTVSFTWNNTKINLIDTPGHIDFVSEVERALHVLDGVILVISAKESVQPQTRIIFRKILELKLPTILFINKLDRMGVCTETLFHEIRTLLTEDIVILQKYIGEGTSSIKITSQNFHDTELQIPILEHCPKLLEKYINDQKISDDEYKNALVSLTQNSTLFPVFGGVALDDIGIKELLTAITEYLKTSQPKCDTLSAYVYKIDRDYHGHRNCYFRVFEGKLKVREIVTIYGSNEKIVIKNLSTINNGKITPVDEVNSGDIGIISDEKLLQFGSILGFTCSKIRKVTITNPFLETCITTNDICDRRNMLEALNELSEEDPLLKFQIDPQTQEVRLRLLGKLQMEIISSLLWDRYHISVSFTELNTICKEYPINSGVASIRLGQGGNHYNAGLVLTIEPLPLGSGFQYENHVSFGYLEKTFQNAVIEGIKSGLACGLNGHEVIDIKVIFQDADYDSVLGTPSDFRKLTPIVFKDALANASVKLLEPWQCFDIVIPKKYDTYVLSDLHKMNAIINAYSYQESETSFGGIVPLSTFINYEVDLLSLTEGKGILLHKLYGFLPCKK